MAGSVNKVILVGNLGRDPESRSFQNGGKVVELRIATSDQWKDRNTGERKERTEWHTVKLFSEGLANVAERYLRKGSKVYIEGALQTRKWQDQQGQDRYTTEVLLQKFRGELQMLDARRQGGENGSVGYSGGGRGSDFGQSSPDDDFASRRGGGNRSGGERGGGSGGGGFGRDLDDEIPF